MCFGSFLLNFLTSSLGAGIAVFIVQKYFEYKLQKILQVHSIKFSWYYVEKAKTITELYARIQKTKYLLASCTNIITYYFSQGATANRDEMQAKLISKYAEFSAFLSDMELWFNQKEIFFVNEQDITDRVRRIINLILTFCIFLKPLNRETECRALANQIEDEIKTLSLDLNKLYTNINEPGK